MMRQNGFEVRSRTRYALALTCTCIGILASSNPAIAATLFYDDSGGPFSLGASWLTGVAPGPSDTAVFATNDSNLAINFKQNNTIQALDVRDNIMTFDLAGFDFNITAVAGIDIGLDTAPVVAATFESSAPGSVITSTNIEVGSPSGGNAQMILTGPNVSLTQTGTSSVDVGDNFNGGAASLNIANQASLTTGTGTLTVGEMGTVDVDSDALLTANGNIVVNGGELKDLDGDNFVWSAGKTMTVLNGGVVRFTGSGYNAPNSTNYEVRDSGSTISGAGGFFHLRGGSTISVSDGGYWNKLMYVYEASSVTVDGPGSRIGGFEIRDGDVTLSNGASANSSFFEIGGSGIGVATLNVLSGATLNKTSTSDLNISSTSFDSEAVVNVDGGGSAVTVFEATIGSTSGNTGTLNIDHGGSYIASTSTTLNATGTINVVNGTALLGDLIDNGGDINFVSGTFGHNGDARIGSGTYLGSSINTSSKSLIFGGTLTIDGGASLSVNGGILSVGALNNFGNFTFNSGKLELTDSNLTIDSAGLLGRTPSISSNRELVVSNTLNVPNTGVLTLSGGIVTAGETVNDGIIRLSSITTVLDGGTLNNRAVITGTGVVSVDLTNQAIGEVRVESFDELIFGGFNNTNNGLIYNDGGFLRFHGNLVNTISGVVSGHGSIRFIGNLNNQGHLDFSQGNANVYGGILNDASGQISAAGTSSAAFYGNVTNNGDVFVGQDSSIIFFGNVSGPGTYSGDGVIEFVGDFSPGASPASVTFEGGVSLSGASKLLIELGGLTAGSEFDQLVIGGDVELNGTLDIQMLGGYTPNPGDSFQIISAATRIGQFGTITGNDLGGGMLLDVVYSPTGVMLQVIGGLAGDLDGDGFVGITDLNIVLSNWNQTIPPGDPLADPSGDNFVGIADLNVVLGNWNAGTPPVDSPAVPEPMTLWIASALLVQAGVRRRTRPTYMR